MDDAPTSSSDLQDITAPESDVRLEHAWGRLPIKQWKNVGRLITLKLTDDATSPTTGDGKFIFEIPFELAGAQLLKVRAFVSTVSASGGPISIQVRNVTTGFDMLSTALTIDDTENSSATAATSAVINPLYSVVKESDQIAIDIDTAGSGAKGLMVYLSLQ